MKTKEEILYNSIASKGGFKGVTFEMFQDSIKNGTPDMRNGLRASFEAMQEYSDQENAELKEMLKEAQDGLLLANSNTKGYRELLEKSESENNELKDKISSLEG